MLANLVFSAELCFVLKLIYLNAAILRCVALGTGIWRITICRQYATLHMTLA